MESWNLITFWFFLLFWTYREMHKDSVYNIHVYGIFGQKIGKYYAKLHKNYLVLGSI
jgi:hypothetical protein